MPARHRGGVRLQHRSRFGAGERTGAFPAADTGFIGGDLSDKLDGIADGLPALL